MSGRAAAALAKARLIVDADDDLVASIRGMEEAGSSGASACGPWQKRRRLNAAAAGVAKLGADLPAPPARSARPQLRTAYSCFLCQLSSESFPELQNHLVTEARRVALFCCHLCQRAFLSRRKLEGHACQHPLEWGLALQEMPLRLRSVYILVACGGCGFQVPCWVTDAGPAYRRLVATHPRERLRVFALYLPSKLPSLRGTAGEALIRLSWTPYTSALKIQEEQPASTRKMPSDSPSTSKAADGEEVGAVGTESCGSVEGPEHGGREGGEARKVVELLASLDEAYDLPEHFNESREEVECDLCLETSPAASFNREHDCAVGYARRIWDPTAKKLLKLPSVPLGQLSIPVDDDLRTAQLVRERQTEVLFRTKLSRPLEKFTVAAFFCVPCEKLFHSAGDKGAHHQLFHKGRETDIRAVDSSLRCPLCPASEPGWCSPYHFYGHLWSRHRVCVQPIPHSLLQPPAKPTAKPQTPAKALATSQSPGAARSDARRRDARRLAEAGLVGMICVVPGCDKRWPTGKMATHMRHKHTNRCGKCLSAFAWYLKMQDHEVKCDGHPLVGKDRQPPPLLCPVAGCDFARSMASQYFDHLYATHPTEVSFEADTWRVLPEPLVESPPQEGCPVCPRTWDSSGQQSRQLRIHVELSHLDEVQESRPNGGHSSFKRCKACGYVARPVGGFELNVRSSKDMAVDHVLKACSALPHCQTCTQAFSSSDQLRGHKLLSHGSLGLTACQNLTPCRFLFTSTAEMETHECQSAPQAVLPPPTPPPPPPPPPMEPPPPPTQNSGTTNPISPPPALLPAAPQATAEVVLDNDDADGRLMNVLALDDDDLVILPEEKAQSSESKASSEVQAAAGGEVPDEDDGDLMIVEGQTSETKPREAKHACSKCSAKFVTGQALVEHEKSHRNDAGLTTEEVLPCPRLTLRDKPIWICRLCCLAYASETAFKAHVSRHGASSSCNACSALTFSAAQTAAHANAHRTRSLFFVCLQCSKAFVEEKDLFTHLLTFRHASPPPPLFWFCKICGLAHSDQRLVDGHLFSGHSIGGRDKLSAIGLVSGTKLHYQPDVNPAFYKQMMGDMLRSGAVAQPGECVHRSFHAKNEVLVLCHSCHTAVPSATIFMEQPRLKSANRIPLSLYVSLNAQPTNIVLTTNLTPDIPARQTAVLMNVVRPMQTPSPAPHAAAQTAGQGAPSCRPPSQPRPPPARQPVRHIVVGRPIPSAAAATTTTTSRPLTSASAPNILRRTAPQRTPEAARVPSSVPQGRPIVVTQTQASAAGSASANVSVIQQRPASRAQDLAGSSRTYFIAPSQPPRAQTPQTAPPVSIATSALPPRSSPANGHFYPSTSQQSGPVATAQLAGSAEKAAPGASSQSGRPAVHSTQPAQPNRAAAASPPQRSGASAAVSLKCEECGEVCVSRASLRVHALRHGSLGIFCLECGTSLRDETELRDHMAAQHGAKEAALQRVVRSGGPAELATACPGCRQRSRSLAALALHVRSCGQVPAGLRCGGCGGAFLSEGGRLAHGQTCAGGGTASCVVCGGGDGSAGHLLKAHLLLRWLMCRQCGLCFTDENKFNQHFSANHVTAEGMCALCLGRPAQLHHVLAAHLVEGFKLVPSLAVP